VNELEVMKTPRLAPNPCSAPMSADRFPAHVVALGIPLGLHVDLIQAKRVLVDDAVHATVAAPADRAAAPLISAVTHGEQNVYDGLLEEGRRRFPKSRQDDDVVLGG